MKLAEVLDIAVKTDCGRVRPNNEDSVFADAGLGVIVLADGMGGNNGGEVASGMATALLSNSLAGIMMNCALEENQQHFSNELLRERLIREIEAVNQAIFNVSLSEVHYAGMGTTLVVACFHHNRMLVAHVGDSRLYRLRNARLEQLTRDHSLLQEYLDSGAMRADDVRLLECRGLLTRALGVAPWVEMDLAEHDLHPQDIVLLCSDGLTDMVPDDLIQDILIASGESPQLAAELLVRTANERGGVDNISVAVLRVRGEFTLPEGWWQKLWAHLK